MWMDPDEVGLFLMNYSSGICNGVALWVDYGLGKSSTISTGLLSPPVDGQELSWYPFSRQGVHFFKRPQTIDVNDAKQHWKLKHRVSFRPKTGEIDVQFLVASGN